MFLLFSEKKYNIINFNFCDIEFYTISFLLVLGSVFLPSFLHLFSLAGNVFLPIYFFVLVGSYKFGPRVGMIVAVFSPVISFLISHMPVLGMLPFVILKSCLLVLFSHVFSKYSRGSMFINLVCVVLLYQLVGSLLVYFFTSNISLSFLDFKIGYPGMAFQVIFGFVVLLLLNNYGRNKFKRD